MKHYLTHAGLAAVTPQIAAHRARLAELRASRNTRHLQRNLKLEASAPLAAASNVVHLAARRVARFPLVEVSR